MIGVAVRFERKRVSSTKRRQDMVFEYVTIAKNERVYLYIGGADGSLRVDWGDGLTEVISTKNLSSSTDTPSHVYAQPGSYRVCVKAGAGRFQHLAKNYTDTDTSLKKVLSWGDSGFGYKQVSLRFCNGLTTISSDNGGAFVNVTSFERCFYECGSLTGIPEDLFMNAVNVTNFSYCFGYCSVLRDTPELLFTNCTNATSFASCFVACRNIEGIPEGLFVNCGNVVSFANCFSRCSLLKSVPEGIFEYNTKVVEFRACFYACTALTGIPEGMFGKNTEVLEVESCFSGCTALTGIPEGMFGNNIKVKEFGACFSGCVNLRGYTCRDSAGELWERAGKNGYPKSIGGVSCFRGCINLSNYDLIPTSWK